MSHTPFFGTACFGSQYSTHSLHDWEEIGGGIFIWVTCINQGLELLVHLDGLSGPQMDGWAELKALATTASVVITEEMPVSPYAQWTQVKQVLKSLARSCD